MTGWTITGGDGRAMRMETREEVRALFRLFGVDVGKPILDALLPGVPLRVHVPRARTVVVLRRLGQPPPD